MWKISISARGSTSSPARALGPSLHVHWRQTCPLDRIVELYQECGPSIFPRKLPQKFGVELVRQIWKRPQYLRAGAIALEKALVAEFGETTLGDIWENREIALAIPAVEISHHRSWIFKTPHLPNTRHRDDGYRLVDVCLATTAAPIYRSMARIKNPDTPGHHVFVDGGLWANNPVLVGLIDALDMTERGDCIEIFYLGTCPRPGGELIGPDELDRGLIGWEFGGGAVSLSLDSQGFAFNEMARMLSQHVERECQIVRFPHGTVPADFMNYLGLDETDSVAMDALVAQAHADVNETLSCCGNTADSRANFYTLCSMNCRPRWRRPMIPPKPQLTTMPMRAKEMKMYNCHDDILAYHNEEVTLSNAEQDEMRERRDTNRQRLKDGLERDGETHPQRI